MKYEPLVLDDTMPFGKHQGLLVADIVDDYPDYIYWLEGEKPGTFHPDVIKEVEKLVN